MTKNMGWQPDREPKGNQPKIVYLCDREKECNKHGACGQCCKHTTDIRHAVNFIDSGDGIHFEERPERKTGRWIETNEIDEWYGRLYRCSVCGTREMANRNTDRHCPNCGADIRGEK